MNYFKKSKFLVATIVVLVILNLGTLISFWLMHPRPEMPPSFDGQDYLEKQLNLNIQQSRLFKLEKEAHQKEFEQIMDSINAVRDKLSEELFKTPLDTNKINNDIAKVGRWHLVEERKIFDHFVRLNSFLNPEQKTKFHNFIEEMIKGKHPSGGNEKPEHKKMVARF